ncbi:MAG: polysaccharide biosynthesis protein [Clostridiaceae bacterium]|nr:polysaccharide biosynthesis protein [Clostridiaceae bacterium]
MQQTTGRSRRLPNIKKFLLAAIDWCLIALSLWGARMLNTGRFINPFDDRYFNNLESLIFWGILSIFAILVFAAFGFYRQLWRFASLPQYLSIFAGTMTHAILLVVFMLLTDRPYDIPFVITYWMMIFLLVGISRVTYRLKKNPGQLAPALGLQSNKRRDGTNPVSPIDDTIRVLVIGAGHAGSQILRDLFEYPGKRKPVALVDDDRHKHGMTIYGVPVIGGRDIIADAVRENQIGEILLAIPSASRETILELVQICNQTGCKLKILPSLNEIINEKVTIRDIKDVEIADLLSRQEIVLDINRIARYIAGRTVMVTGGGGSIGSELCRQVARFSPHRLIIFDIYENNAYELEQELRAAYGDQLTLQVLIGSVRDTHRLDEVMDAYKPDIIFHAAAHKHVPLMEDSPGEAVKNNIFGTYNTALAAARHHVSRFVLISTDKAVNPTNVMGATKRIAELVIQSLARQYPETQFAAVRFGNVLGSSGSVIPIFKHQIQNERRVTVTHPEITRYFMTIPEAARLVIQAGALANGGGIFVLDMGEPIKIDDLARDLIRLSGLEPETDVKIEYTGLRPGEKMFEELYMDHENMTKTVHEKIFAMNPIVDHEQLAQEMKRLTRVIRWNSDQFSAFTDELLQKLAEDQPVWTEAGSNMTDEAL